MARRSVVTEADALAVDEAVRAVGETLRLRLQVRPRSKREVLESAAGGGLLLRILAPPVDGKANARVVEVLSELLGVSKRQITITAGATSRQKEFSVEGIALEEARALLRA